MDTVVRARIVLDEKGVAYIEGTTAKVIEVVLNQQWTDCTAEDLQLDMPHLTLDQIHAALKYYHEHKRELDEDIERRRQLVERMRQEAGPSPVAARLRSEGKIR
jgi:uncharacterized protein (DUF433 family)